MSYKGDKSNLENSTDRFCGDTVQNALADLTSYRWCDPFQPFGPWEVEGIMEDAGKKPGGIELRMTWKV